MEIPGLRAGREWSQADAMREIALEYDVKYRSASEVVSAASPSMSKEYVNPWLVRASPRDKARSMSCPRTNWRPISRMACLIAERMTGSPRRFSTARNVAATPCPSSASVLPVSINAQVEALTSDELDLPRCSLHLDGTILSSINASTVAASGTRSMASARHIKAMPSSVESPYSARKSSMNPC